MTSSRLRRTLITAAVTGLVAAAAITAGLAGFPRFPGSALASVTGPAAPRPPRLPADFRATGRYIVRDLGVNVPFTWQGRGGNSQMIAGGPQYRIWFTNVIYRGTLYTATYKWPNLRRSRRCDRVGPFSLRDLNNGLRTARLVGAEILQGNPDRQVYHWRVGVVAGSARPGLEIRFPLALADIYVSQQDPSQWWQVLQFGLQNIYDPALDEWFTLSAFSHQPGTVTLPAACPPPVS